MAKRKKVRWSYSTGQKGRNRIRAFEHPSGVLMLEFRDNGRRKRISLGHRDQDRAVQQAHEAAEKLANAEALIESGPPPLTLGALFETYLEEVTPTKAATTQKHDRRATAMFSRYFGSD